MSRPTDWEEVFGFGDPTPGDPYQISRVATSWSDLADDAEYAEGKLRQLLGDEAISGWIGQAGDAFREKSYDLPGQLEKCKNSYRLASSALSTWSTKLDGHQGDADRALEDGRAAKQELSSANSSLEDAGGSSVLAFLQQYQDSPPPPDVEPPSASEIQTARHNLSSAQGAVNSAQGKLDAARKLASDAGSLREDDGKTCADEIREASDAGIEERSWWEKAKDWIADAWDVIVEICKIVVLVLGVVALILGGPLAWVVFAAAVIVLADTVMKYLKGEAGLLDVLLAAVDCIPGAKGLTSVAKLGALASKGKTALTAVVKGIKSGFGRKTIATFGKNVVKFKSAKGLTKSFEANLKETFTLARSKDMKDLTSLVGKLGKTGDHGGHLIGHRFLPLKLRKNLIPMNGNFNTSAFKKLENEWGDWIKNGMEINVKGAVSPVGAIRPDKLKIIYEVTDPATGALVHNMRVTFANMDGQVFDRIYSKDMAAMIKQAVSAIP